MCIRDRLSSRPTSIPILKTQASALVAVVVHISVTLIQRSIVNGALVVDGNGKKKVIKVYRGDGRKRYEIFAPSQPQAVNQYVHDYNYGTQDSAYMQAMEQYKGASARKYCRTAHVDTVLKMSIFQSFVLP